MSKSNFEGAEITIYTKEGEQFSIALSSIQTIAAMKILGVIFNDDSYSCYSDQTIKELFKYKGNPLRLQAVEEEEI